MKYVLTTLKTIVAVGMLVTATPVLAQTTDGEMPGQETVCDPLQQDDITKGLYGLCVAFCEAGDYANELDTITPEELATLETTTPSGRILANYNKKKDKANNPLDPDMPCILVEEPCPCWTADELAETADGIHNISGSQPEYVGCVHDGLASYNTYDVTFKPRAEGGGIYKLEQAAVFDDVDFQGCHYQVNDPTILTVASVLSIQAGTLTEVQHDSCVEQMAAHWDTRTACTEGNHP